MIVIHVAPPMSDKVQTNRLFVFLNILSGGAKKWQEKFTIFLNKVDTTKLQVSLHKLLFNRSNNCESSNKEFKLVDVTITPPVLSLLVQLLNQPLPRRPSQNDKDTKWDEVVLCRCYIQERPRTLQTSDNISHCSTDDMYVLFSTLMSRTGKLMLHESPWILVYLTRIPQLDLLEMSSLEIEQQNTSLSGDEYARLGDMILRSSHLTRLHVVFYFSEVPLQMFESLASATNIQDLRFGLSSRHFDQEIKDTLSRQVVGEGGSGFVLRLLQNPHCRLQYLNLNRIGLKDDQFIAIVQVLPASHLRRLDVGNNKIQSRAILEFAEQLPNIQSLKRITLGPNPWWPYFDDECYIEVEKCCMALLQGMMKNYSVEDIDELTDSEYFCFYYPHVRLMAHYMDINRAGRRILEVSDSVPLGLWPFILERAGTRISYNAHYGYPSGQRKRVQKANALYFLLRNCPVFSTNR